LRIIPYEVLFVKNTKKNRIAARYQDFQLPGVKSIFNILPSIPAMMMMHQDEKISRKGQLRTYINIKAVPESGFQNSFPYFSILRNV
jgi:hypothetical protein